MDRSPNQYQICIVDDEKELADTFSQCLRDDYAVKTFYSATEALQAFDQQYKPDLVISDLKMPQIDGLQFVDELRQKKSSVPVILMSGYADRNNTLKAFEKEVFGFLAKPFGLETLLPLIHRAVSHSQKARLQAELQENYSKIAHLSLDLNTLFRTRFEAAESRLQELGIPMYTDPTQAMRFVETMQMEHEIEKKISAAKKLVDAITAMIRTNCED